MTTAKSLLLGSAAGLCFITAAPAADMPVKAKPVEYVRICPQFGAGFWYVPGTETCIKVGMQVRFQWSTHARGNGRVFHSGAQGRFTRTDHPELSHRVRSFVSVDTRTQTEWGLLRGYVRVGAEQQTPNDPDESPYFPRAFVQWGGFTVGRAESAYDFLNMSRFNINNQRNGSNMNANGQQTFAYTWRLPERWRATLALEDGGAASAGANPSTSRSRMKLTSDLDAASFAMGALTVDNGSYAMPDIVGNLRVDGEWGAAAVKAALHQNRAGYYSGFPPAVCAGGTANTTNCGHPDDKIGWAVGAGAIINIPGQKGSFFGIEANYGEGAMGYIARANDVWRIWGSGPSVGQGHSPESVFRNGTDLELTRAWSVVGGYEHRWTEQWSTSIFGGYNKADFSARAEDMICSRGAFAGTARPFSGFTVTNCSPDFAFWNIGTRVKWMPHPLLEISTSVQMYRLETAHAGAGVVTANDGARPAGPVTFEDQDVFLFHLRLEYEIVP